MKQVKDIKSLKEKLDKTLSELNESLEIKHEKGVAYDRKGKRRVEEKIFVRFFTGFRESGWLAKLRRAELAVLIALGLRMDVDRQCFPSILQLSRDTGYKRDAVILALQSLEKKGLISKEKRRTGRGKFKKNLYTVLPLWIKGIERKER